MVSGITSVKGASGAIKADTAQRSSLAKFGKQASYGGLYCAFTYPPSGYKLLNLLISCRYCLTPNCTCVKRGQRVLITLARLTLQHHLCSTGGEKNLTLLLVILTE